MIFFFIIILSPGMKNARSVIEGMDELWEKLLTVSPCLYTQPSFKDRRGLVLNLTPSVCGTAGSQEGRSLYGQQRL